MAIGLEIEIAVPIDGLTAADISNIRADVIAAEAAYPGSGQNTAAGHRVRLLTETLGRGRVAYGPLVAPARGFRIDCDHDNRVITLPAPTWPPYEGGKDSLIEIVMDPPAETLAQFNTTMDNIQVWINTMMLRTNNLTRRWVDGLGLNRSVGPLTWNDGGGYPGRPTRKRSPHHNLKGSIQVNVGIDLREYHSMLKWFANSKFARSKNASSQAEQAAYREGKHAIREAVDIGRKLTEGYLAKMSPTDRARVGNLRGLRGWITHMALYMKRGALTKNPGGTAKNLAPTMLKSPPAVAAQYGMTGDESAYFTGHREEITRTLLHSFGRDLQIGSPLDTVDVFATSGGYTLDQLTNLASTDVALAGKPLLDPTGVGPARTGNADVQGLPSVAAGAGIIGGGPGTRGGVVTEIRSIPGLYEGVAAWRRLGQQFLQEADKRNQRSGVRP
jgi:hypothetical protein